MLHLGCRIAFGMDVRDLLELQCALEGYRIVVATTEIEEIARIGERQGDALNLVVLLEDLLDLGRDLHQFADGFLIILLFDRTLRHAQGEGEQRQHNHLTCECLGGSYTNLGTYVNVGAGMCFAGDGTTYPIHDAIDESALLLGQLNGCQGVGSLARLADGDHDIIGLDDRIGIAEFGGISHLDRNAAEMFDELLTDQAGMP